MRQIPVLETQVWTPWDRFPVSLRGTDGLTAAAEAATELELQAQQRCFKITRVLLSRVKGNVFQKLIFNFSKLFLEKLCLNL